MAYEVYKKGQITKFEAGVIYRAMKEGNINVLPETPKNLYVACDAYIRFADERYRNDPRYYDRIYDCVKNILDKNYKAAQEAISEWEQDLINRAGKKSMFFKYKKELNYGLE